jgi:uncharacterized protein (UPF0335 family)
MIAELSRYEAYHERFGRLESDISELKRDVGDVRQKGAVMERDLLLMKWMLGFVLAFQVAIFIKLFLH